VVLHLWVTLQHGAAHDALQVPLSAAQTAFVYAVILAAPLIAAALVWTRWMASALWLTAAAFAGAAAFGVYHHYILISPDNVAHLPDGPAHLHQAFTSTAAYIAVIESAAAAAGLFLCGYWTGRKHPPPPM
jgi:hypothetical protein